MSPSLLVRCLGWEFQIYCYTVNPSQKINYIAFDLCYGHNSLSDHFIIKFFASIIFSLLPIRIYFLMNVVFWMLATKCHFDSVAPNMFFRCFENRLSFLRLFTKNVHRWRGCNLKNHIRALLRDARFMKSHFSTINKNYIRLLVILADLNGSSGSISDLKPKGPGFESQIRQGYICWWCGSKRSGCVMNVSPCGSKVKEFALKFPKNLITN
jgi:hypothetical protein